MGSTCFVRMFCQFCVDAKKKNAFTAGCDKFNKHSLQKHVVTVDHRSALEATSCRKDLQRAFTTAYS